MNGTDELKMFVFVHGRPLEVGMMVKVDSSHEYAGDWPEEYIVTGINWDNCRQIINVTIADNWEDGGADGWSPEDLNPA